MTRKLNDSLLTSLIYFDFLVVDHKNNTHRALAKQVVSRSHPTLNTKLLNHFEIIRALKQISRMSAFLLKNSNSNMHISTLNPFFARMMNFLASAHLKDKISVNHNFSLEHLKPGTGILALENTQKLQSFYHHLFSNNVYLIGEISMTSFFQDRGAYKLYNKMDSYKKLMFLAFLLKKLSAK